MTTYPKPADPVASLTRADGTTELHSTDHGRVIGVWENVKHHGATGDGVTDDTAAISAAITTAGGGTVYFPKGTYLFSSTLTPLSNSQWVGSGARSWDYTTGGTVLQFSGTSTTAIQLGTGVSNIRMRDFQIYCTSDTSGVSALKFVDPASNCHLSNIVLKGPGTSNAIGVLFDGQVSCTCHNVFDTVYVRNWLNGFRLSGVANSNVLSNCAFATCTTALYFAKQNADTFAGSDNLIQRCEFDGGITNGIWLADSASRNAFVKCTLDGTYTNDVLISGGSEDNTFLGCHFSTSGIIDDTSATATYIACTGLALTQNLRGDGWTGDFHLLSGNLSLDGTNSSILFTGSNPGIGSATIGNAERQNTAFYGAVTGEANREYQFSWHGKHSWGPGGATALDTTFERSAANVLALGSDDAIKTGAAVHASLPSPASYAAGAQFYCTSDKKPVWSDGGSHWVDAAGANHT